MNEKTISRRSLLKLASASTVTAAAVLPSAARAAQADQWDETYEIIVVGAGGAGMAAAVKAAQKGAKHVVVLEKLNFPGGNTLISQGSSTRPTRFASRSRASRTPGSTMQSRRLKPVTSAGRKIVWTCFAAMRIRRSSGSRVSACNSSPR